MEIKTIEEQRYGKQFIIYPAKKTKEEGQEKKSSNNSGTVIRKTIIEQRRDFSCEK